MKKSAFTLIELSVVLVIIGLLIGGVLVGRDMIKSGEVRAQVSQLQEYATAMIAFKTQYRCLPGDCEVATDYNLGANGNGNGTLDAATYNSPDGFFDGEYPLFFIHLTAAKLVKGKFNGAVQVGVGYPKLVINDYGMIAAGEWQAGTTGTVPNSLTTAYNFQKGTWLYGEMCAGPLHVPGGSIPVGANDAYGVITPNQAYNIDKKIDDGNPIGGKFWAYSSATIATDYCTNSPYNIYNMQNKILACQFAYQLD